MDFQIRPARPADAPTVTEFNRRMAAETEGLQLDPSVLSSGVKAALADPNKGRYLVAESEDRVIGQLMWTLEWSDWRNGWFWWIQSVYVAPEARRHGVYSALYAHLLDLATRQGDVIGVRLYVEEHNQRAQATYVKQGMVRTHYLVYERCPL